MNDRSSLDVTVHPRSDVTNRSPLDWIIVGVISALAGVVGLYGVFFLPVFVGSLPLPLVIIPVGLVVMVLPRLTYRLTGRMVAAALPVVVWFLVTVWLYVDTNSLFTNAPIAWRGGWQFMTLLGVGVLGAAASVGTLWGDHLRAQILARSGARTGLGGVGSGNVTADGVQRPPGDGGY